MKSVSLEEFIKLRDSGVNILDSRPTSDFSNNHIPGSISISINGSFERMVSYFFHNKDKLVLVSKANRLSESILRLEGEGFLCIKYFDIDLWTDAGMKCVHVTRVKSSEASKYTSEIIDISNSEDWEVLHVKGVSNVPLVELIKSPNLIPADSVLYCGNGHKSMTAVSFLLTKNIITTDITGGLSAMLVDSPDLEI